MIALLSIGIASAQVVPDVPQTAGDLFRPAVGSPLLGTEATRWPGVAVASAHLTGVGQVLRVEVDGDSTPIVREVVALHLGARFAVGPVQLGLDAPAYLLARTEDSRALLGDPSVVAKVAGGAEGWGVGGMLRVGTSLGASARGLGYPGPFAEIGALADVDVGGLTVVGNAGVRLVPAQQLGDVTLDDVVWGRVGATLTVTPWLAPLVEVAAQAPIAGEGGGFPVEVLMGASVRCAPGTLQLGVGRGLTNAVGSPGWRLVLGLTWAAPGTGDTRPAWSCRPTRPSTT